MTYDAIIVGGGMAGLTSAAFLSQSGYQVLLCEKEEELGGLVGSFEYKSFTFDAGIRALENSGVLFPMLRKLDMDIDFLPNPVFLGIKDDIVDLSQDNAIEAYEAMLHRQFPKDKEAIHRLIDVMEKTMDYMQILYGIDNPLFMDLKTDFTYLRKTLLPWMFKYLPTVGKIKPYNIPVETYLKTITDNQVLIDVIAQHFFKATPAFFALSYFSLYFDYKYPRGGTGAIVEKMTDFILNHGGTIKKNTLITSINPAEKIVTNNDGQIFEYKELIWAADTKALYAGLEEDTALPSTVQEKIKDQASFLSDKVGGDSVLTLYLTVDLPPNYFKEINGPHFFYTPLKKGLSTIPVEKIRDQDGTYTEDQENIFAWIEEYLQSTTFEVSIPVLRDETLAPEGKTGLIISTLLDHSLVKHIEEKGWYPSFKTLSQQVIIETLTSSVYPKLKDQIMDGFVSTPLTIEKRTGNADGAITGWAFTNETMPAVSSMPHIAKAIKTPIPNVVQAGQWTYSPAGFPISILTGKMAADHVKKTLK